MFGATANKSPVACECPGVLNDTPSEVSWFWAGGTAFPLLAASAWDGTVSVWEIQTNKPLVNTPTAGLQPVDSANDPAPSALNAVGKNQVNLGSPVLCCRFINAQTVVAGTLDKRVMLVKLGTNEVVQVGRHENWVRRVFFDERNQSICSVSYDNTVKWWNGQPNAASPLHSLQFQGKIADADIGKEILVLMTEDHKLTVYSLGSLATPPKTFTIPAFTYPLTSVRLFANGNGVCAGSVEGRARIVGFLGKATDDFAFRCHRLDDQGELLPSTSIPPEKHNVYAANALDFNPIYDTLITGGGDGHTTTWDKDNRVKLHSGPRLPAAVNCLRYDCSGRLLALGLGYDWQLGIVGKQQKAMPNKVIVMAMQDSWIKKKNK